MIIINTYPPGCPLGPLELIKHAYIHYLCDPFIPQTSRESVLCARHWAASGPWGHMGNETALASRRLLGKRKGGAVWPELELDRLGHGQEEETAWAKAQEVEVWRVLFEGSWPGRDGGRADSLEVSQATQGGSSLS